MAKMQEFGSRQEFERRVIELAEKDADFRRALIEKPRRALLDRFQLELPGDVELKVLQETPGTFYLILPAETELAEADLEKVAGGMMKSTGLAFPAATLISTAPTTALPFDDGSVNVNITKTAG